MMNPSTTLCIGISHRTAPVALREAMSCPVDALAATLAAEPARYAPIHEWVLLSTCNRFELYVQLATGVDAQFLVQWLRATSPFDVAQLHAHLYVIQGEDVARHLLRVAAGLDSQVLGEPQILGQVSTALESASANRWAGPHLKALFRAAIRAGKRAQSETAIGRRPSSISSVAVSHIEAANGSLAEQEILLLGAGEMAQLAANTLRKRGAGRLAVANRSCARARELLSDQEGDLFRLDQLHEALLSVDVVICATSAPHLILTQELVATAQRAREGRPLLVVDIAMPRDVEPAVGDLPGVTLINLDALHDRLESARSAREREVPQVEMIVREETDAWRHTVRELRVQPLIRELRQKAEAIRQRELTRTLKHLGGVDPATREHITHLSRALVNQLLHEPTHKLREEAGNGEPAELASAVQNLFNLAP